MVEFPTFMGSWPWPWPWIRAWSLPFFLLSSSTTCIPNFIEIEETFLWTDGHTDVRTEICHLLGRLPKFGSRPNKVVNSYSLAKNLLMSPSLHCMASGFLQTVLHTDNYTLGAEMLLTCTFLYTRCTHSFRQFVLRQDNRFFCNKPVQATKETAGGSLTKNLHG